MTAIRVLLVDDQTLFRAGLRTLLSTRDEVLVVGEAGDGQQALRLAGELRPDVVLMDLKMPVLDGVATTRRLRVQLPDCQVVALTTFEDDALVFEVLRAGAVGYLLKDAPVERLVEAIRAAARRESVLQPSVASKVLAELSRLASAPAPDASPLARLSDREREVLRLIARGASNKEIAAALFVTEGTIKNHVTSILAKLEVDDRTQAALRARDLGLV
ncbi:MAG: response regulator transcription factor [Deltaproteobacteria bacterium]|nr:response regulator transcription factor [Deltaproteobacteria bacterium]